MLPERGLSHASGRAHTGSWMSGSLEQRILVVDDDADIRLLVAALLETAGYAVESCANGGEALRVFHERPADLVLLDISMPELDGFETLERLRDLGDVPVILLTAHSGEIDKVRGFRAGADDYVVKPFGRQELLARIEAQLRRTPKATLLDGYDDGLLTVDFASRLVTYAGLPVRLTPLEFRLLAALVRRAGQVLTVDELLEQGWGRAAGAAPEQVKLYVSYLRKKLGPSRGRAAPIETVRGFGYRYAAPR